MIRHLYSLIPAFDWHRVMVEPWTNDPLMSFWIVLMGFLVAATCGLVGNYLLLRRMTLIGDAISHSILPGLILAFLIFKSTGIISSFIGALAAGFATVLIIEFIHKKSRIKPDAAISIVFTLFFAAGVAMMSMLESKGSFHIDAECVLYGEIAFVPIEPPFIVGGLALGPPSIIRMALMLFLVLSLISAFYKELLITSFDSDLARSLGMNTGLWHYGLMGVLSLAIVSAFEAVGAILAVAMLIVPAMFAAQLSNRLLHRFLLTLLHAAAGSVLGFHLAQWLQCSIAGAMVVAGAGLFVVAWIATSLKFISPPTPRQTITSPSGSN